MNKFSIFNWLRKVIARIFKNSSLDKNYLYFKRHWNETTGDPLTDSWGTSTYYFETKKNGEVLRQVEAFKNGIILKYSSEKLEDQYGALADIPLDLEEFEEYKIYKEEFEKIWK